MSSNKTCPVCVYNGVCADRLRDDSITDCCVPEAPLRSIQSTCTNADEYASKTNDYVMSVKAKSQYWRNELGLK